MKKSDLIFSAILIPIDYLMIVLAAIAAYALRYVDWIQKIRPIIFDLKFNEYWNFVWSIALGWIFIFIIAGLYEMNGPKKIFPEIGKIFLACSTGILTVIVSAFFSRELFNSRFILLFAWIFSFVFVTIARMMVRGLQKLFYLKGRGVHKIVLVGSDDSSENIAKEIYRHKNLGYKIVDRFNNFDSGNQEKIIEFYKQKAFDEIWQTDSSLDRKENLKLLDFANENHLVFKYAADFFATQSSNFEIYTLAGVPMVEVKRTALDGWGRILKRIFDIIFSVLFLIILSPVFLIIAVLVKFDSRGNVFYSQVRVGTQEKRIKIHKFRSMVMNAERLKSKLVIQNERSDGPLFKIEDDPRITRVGKFIRAWSIDELPQLWNVLIGEMSLVGPRPHLPEEVAKYEKRHKKLLNIKPGITGLSQVSGRSDLYFEEEARLDTFYIENWSLWLDLIILIKTPFVVLMRKGAK